MRNLVRLCLPAAAASLLLAACGSSASTNTAGSPATAQSAAQTSSSSSGIVRTASSSLGTILVNDDGMTLYHLSGEVNGKFICTSAGCLGVWHPLIAPSSGVASGAAESLGTVKRPEGTTQVTYKGTPLYTFTGDRQAGETNGQGLKDVGVWSAVTTSSAGTAASATGSSSEPAGSGGGGYSY